MVSSFDAEDTKTLLVIPFPMRYVIIDQLALISVDNCLDNRLYRYYVNRLLCFSKIRKIDYSKVLKIRFVKFCMFNFKQYILLSFQWISTILVSNSKLGYALFKIKEMFKIKQKTSVLLGE